MRKSYVIHYQIHDTNIVFSSEPYSDLTSAVRDYYKVELKNKKDNVWISEQKGRNTRIVKSSGIGKILEDIVERER